MVYYRSKETLAHYLTGKGEVAMELTKGSKQIVEKLYHGRTHVELSIGTLKDGAVETVRLGPDGKRKEGESLVYPAGSICKIFTASLFAKYLAEGKLELEAPLSRYIHGLPEQYYPSLRKLATHSSGYGGRPYSTWDAMKMLLRMNAPDGLFRVNPYHGTVNESDMMRILADTHLKDRPYKFQYSNLGMSVLGYIVGQVSGQGFWDGMESYIREDLGLKTARLGNTSMLGYDKKDQPCGCWQWDKSDIIAPAGALLASVEDLLDFARQHLDGSKPYLEICHKQHGPGEKGFVSGLAWRLEQGTDISWHDGAAGAYSAFVGLDRKKKTAVALAVNYGLVDTKELAFSILNAL